MGRVLQRYMGSKKIICSRKLNQLSIDSTLRVASFVVSFLLFLGIYINDINVLH